MTKFYSRKVRGIVILTACCVSVFILTSFNRIPPIETGTLSVTFINTASGKPVTLEDAVYVNPFGEVYTITKLKYYVSSFTVEGAEQQEEIDPYHLVNAA